MRCAGETGVKRRVGVRVEWECALVGRRALRRGTGALRVVGQVGQHVPRAQQQVVAQEEATQRVLHAAAHFHEVLQELTAAHLVGLHVHHADGNQEVPVSAKATVHSIKICILVAVTKRVYFHQKNLCTYEYEKN